jgi:aryl-alcohol dehydrogenase-like predicted oxidoreductase
MDYVRLGATGLKVSRLCLGCMSFGSGMDWMLSEADSRVIIKKSVEAGINFFDTADIYSHGESELITGKALKDFGPPREETVIATKVFHPMGEDPNRRGLSRKHIMHSIDASLERLGVDYVDLYQIHRFDYSTPIEETLEALDEVVKSGKALYIGASTMWAWQFAKLQFTADRLGTTRFVSMQNHYNLLYREEEREMNPLCVDQGVGLIPWSPIAGGLLAGSRKAGTVRSKSPMIRDRFKRPADEAVIDAVAKVAAARGCKPAEVAMAWLLGRPGVASPIIGVTKPEHLDDPLKALETTLTDEEIAELEAPYVAQPAMGIL